MLKLDEINNPLIHLYFNNKIIAKNIQSIIL